MYKFGLEIENFLVDSVTNNPVVVPPCLPMDDCGLLVEFRGQPFDSIEDAVASVMASKWKVERTIRSYPELASLSLCSDPVRVVDKATVIKARRIHEKGLIRYQNIYGDKFLDHRHKANEVCAGLHLSVTRPVHIYRKDETYVAHNGVWDFASLVRYLDTVFAEEIRNSKRNPGFYEIKDDGRIEYRSLPCDTDLTKLMDAVHSWKKS